MNDAALVSSLERLRYLQRQLQGLVDWNRAACEAVCQRLSFNQFENEKLDALMFFNP